ncbi:hypothetical protein JKP88DRAFT_266364 [Tribonema minus]|uniref:Uncharacterized protein n=1 Tax=Tribonema minus TaxID=303371 RepID=A0A835ZE53_9STRA|nr:hypothetical protein JKP88DRAFT_266364 [Tribonema minus]
MSTVEETPVAPATEAAEAESAATETTEKRAAPEAEAAEEAPEKKQKTDDATAENGGDAPAEEAAAAAAAPATEEVAAATEQTPAATEETPAAKETPAEPAAEPKEAPELFLLTLVLLVSVDFRMPCSCLQPSIWVLCTSGLCRMLIACNNQMNLNRRLKFKSVAPKPIGPEISSVLEALALAARHILTMAFILLALRNLRHRLFGVPSAGVHEEVILKEKLEHQAQLDAQMQKKTDELNATETKEQQVRSRDLVC